MSQRGFFQRRSFLRGAGAAVALPMFGGHVASGAAQTGEIRRTVMICAGLGFHTPYFFPSAEGFDYEITPYLRLLEEHRNQLTLFSGLSHPQQNGNNGHASSLTWLTSAPRPGLAGFKNTVSLDQLMANHYGGMTRMPYLCLANDGGSLAWTANGVNIPAEKSPAKLFEKLFIAGRQQEVSRQLDDLRRGQSILDTIQGEAKQFNLRLGPIDQHKLDEYFTAIRELEIHLDQEKSWATKPKPKVEYEQPQDIADKQDIVAKQRLMYDMIVLALQTDSTRVVTLSLGGMNAVPSNIPGVKTDWHNLSHHGKDESKIDELRLIEEAEFKEFSRFLGKLGQIDEDGGSLLDHTAVLFGSNLGNASAHDWHNLPIILAGGGYRHGSYIAHDAQNNTPLANLFVALAQRMGLEIDQFGSSTAASIRGLEI